MDPDDTRPRRHQFNPQEFGAQLAARLESLAKIEQAKGIIMAKLGCTEVLAFDILRAASQGCNVPVRDLAAQLIAQTARNQPAPGSGPHISGGNDRDHALLDLLSALAPGHLENGPARSHAHTPRLPEMVAACDTCNERHTFRGTASEITEAAKSWSQTHQCTPRWP